MSGFGNFFDKVKAQASVAGAQANSMFQVSARRRGSESLSA